MNIKSFIEKFNYTNNKLPVGFFFFKRVKKIKETVFLVKNSRTQTSRYTVLKFHKPISKIIY